MKILKAVKKEMSTDLQLAPNAPPLVATTVTLEAIQDALTLQDVLHTQAYSIEGLFS